MIEMIIGFVFGYVWSRVSISSTHVDLRFADKILTWDQNCLGWRPVMSQNEIESDAVYLAAFELNSLPVKVE